MTRYFYSAKTGGFYLDIIHTEMPDDAFEINEQQYRDLLQAQSQGKRIVFKKRKLTLEDPQEPEMTWEDIRAKRDRLLLASDWTQMPDVSMGEQLAQKWRDYRVSLRDLTDAFKSPSLVEWPVAPSGKR